VLIRGAGHAEERGVFVNLPFRLAAGVNPRAKQIKLDYVDHLELLRGLL
jgi:hypothetical protein